MLNKFKIKGNLMKKIIIAFMLLFVFGCTEFKHQFVDVEIGQTWVYKCEDPFYGFTKTMKIIDIKDGYVKYEYTYSNIPDKVLYDSESIWWVKRAYTLIE